MTNDYEDLILELNDKEYALNEDLKRRIEERAEREFADNYFLDYYWGSNERGDPILYIETEGPMVPWDRLEKLEFEMAPTEQQQDDDADSGEVEDLDNGNGVKSVPRENVDMGTPGAGPNSGDDEDSEEPDTKFMVTHPSKNYIPQPDDDDPEKLPPHPDELPEDPTLVTWIPDDNRTEVWTTGRAITSVSLFLEWNLQLKADEAPDNSTRFEPVLDDAGNAIDSKQVQRTHSHDEWEEMMEQSECEVVRKLQRKQSPPTQEQQRGYSGRTSDESKDGIAGGNNWGFGNR